MHLKDKIVLPTSYVLRDESLNCALDKLMHWKGLIIKTSSIVKYLINLHSLT